MTTSLVPYARSPSKLSVRATAWSLLCHHGSAPMSGEFMHSSCQLENEYTLKLMTFCSLVVCTISIQNHVHMIRALSWKHECVSGVLHWLRR